VTDGESEGRDCDEVIVARWGGELQCGVDGMRLME